MVRKMFRLCTVLMAIVLLTASVIVPAGYAAESKDPLVAEIPSKMYGIKISDTTEYINAVAQTTTSQQELQCVRDAVKNYVPAVDNSTDPYFPKIGTQGSINSCGAWSAVYYQFTHEMNRALGRTTTP